MIQRNEKQIRGSSKGRARVANRTRIRSPQIETGGYEQTTSRLTLFIDPPCDKPVYSIGELVAAAYERAGWLTNDPASEALVATRLLAEWLIHARAAAPRAEAAAEAQRTGATVRRQHETHRTPRGPSQRGGFTNAPGFRAAA